MTLSQKSSASRYVVRENASVFITCANLRGQRRATCLRVSVWIAAAPGGKVTPCVLQGFPSSDILTDFDMDSANFKDKESKVAHFRVCVELAAFLRVCTKR